MEFWLALLGGGGFVAVVIYAARRFQRFGHVEAENEALRREVGEKDHDIETIKNQRDHGIHAVDDADDFWLRLREKNGQ